MAKQLNAESEVFEICREWQRLAAAEGKAVATRNWNLCAACQTALQNLRERLSALLPAVRAEWRQDRGNGLTRQKAFDDTLRRLIELEHRTQTMLQTLRETACVKRQQLTQARIQLHQLRRSYGSTASRPCTRFL